jgi:hypothetical protein
VDAVRHLPHESATVRAELGDLWDWNHLAANMADLVDLLSYWLTSEYAKWTHDPDDPETKRRAAERKRRGIKPPPHPLIPPVAHRPPSVAAKYEDQYLRQLAEHAPAEEPAKRVVSLDEWERAAGLVS